jgi:outer membrane protein
MGFRVKLVASALVLALAATAVGGAQAQSITQALTIAYDHAPDLQSALLNAKASAENVALANAGKRPTIGASVGGTYAWSVGQAATPAQAPKPPSTRFAIPSRLCCSRWSMPICRC